MNIIESKMKTIFITRTKSEKDLKDSDLCRLVEEVFSSGINELYVISDFDALEYKIGSRFVRVVKDEEPTSPVSINSVLNLIKKEKKEPGAFLICSKEVALKRKDIKELNKIVNKNISNLLVVGYKFEIANNDRLKKELEEYYAKDLIAYQVPWNTCAIWNYGLFDKFVHEFDAITNKKPFNKICVYIDNICSETDQKGMEDGLAIAKAISQKKEGIYCKLLNKKLPWRIDLLKKRDHQEKLARKEIVMERFIKEKGYSLKDLDYSSEQAKIDLEKSRIIILVISLLIIFFGWEDRFANVMITFSIVSLVLLLFLIMMIADFVVLKSLFYVSAELSFLIFLAQSYCSVKRSEASDQALQILMSFGILYVIYIFLDSMHDTFKRSRESVKNEHWTKEKIFVSVAYLLFVILFLWNVASVMSPIINDLCIYKK